MGDSAFTPRTRYRRAGCTQTCPSGSGGGGWIPLVTGGWPPTSYGEDVSLGAHVDVTGADQRKCAPRRGEADRRATDIGLRAGSDVIDAAHLQTVGRQTSVAE